MINWEDLPKDCIKVFWKNRKERIGNMIQNLIESSDGKMIISMTPEFHKATDDLRTYLFQNVYQNA